MYQKLQKLTTSVFLGSGASATQLNLHIYIGPHRVYKGKYLISGTLGLAMLLLMYVTRYSKLEK